MKTNASGILLLGLGFLIVGCASFAKRLEAVTVSKIQPGSTTRPEVEQRLGVPSETVRGTNGTRVVRYFFHEFERSMDVSHHRRRFEPGLVLFRTLTLSYSPEEVVTRRLYDESLTPIYRTNAWFSAGPVLTSASTAFCQRGVTTHSEAVDRLGRPSSHTFDQTEGSVLVWFSLKTRQSNWSDPDIGKLIMRFDERGVLGDFTLVEHVRINLDPLALP